MKHVSREISERVDLDHLEKQFEDRLQNQLHETDRFYTERLCQRYRDLVPPERIRAMQDLPTVFEDRKHFEQSYLRVAGEKPAEDVVGFSQKTIEPAHVATDHVQMRKTIIHERLHQLSDPAAERQLGSKLDEGITEDLAIKELGNEWNPELPRSYPREQAMAHNVRELCGDRAVDRAYFQGDARELKVCLEHRLGKDNLDKLECMADSRTN
ncbi:MAG: hypothetical protein WCB27_08445 [Thermoguttaceae bacterium]